MSGVRIEIKHIKGIEHKLKKGKVVLTLDTDLNAADLCRLIHISGQGWPISAIIESPQAMFDLHIETVNISNGEPVATVNR